MYSGGTNLAQPVHYVGDEEGAPAQQEDPHDDPHGDGGLGGDRQGDLHHNFLPCVPPLSCDLFVCELSSLVPWRTLSIFAPSP